MEQLFIEANGAEYSVEISEDAMWYRGDAYPIDRWERLDTKETGWSYQSRSKGGEMHDSLNDDCKLMFSFLFCWRGVWEGRIYFPDGEEYWCEDLKEMYLLWDKIQAVLKDKIRAKEPDRVFED